jgi:hypothetical protein
VMASRFGNIGDAAPPRVTGVPVLYLDFDGVLHPEEVYQRRGSSPYVKHPPGHILFEYAELLTEILKPYPELTIVLSTSWARVFSFSRASKALPPALKHRCIGATWHREMDGYLFEATPRGHQVLDDVERRRPIAWLAIDDDSSGWGSALEKHVVVTDPVLGISEPTVMRRLNATLERF